MRHGTVCFLAKPPLGSATHSNHPTYQKVTNRSSAKQTCRSAPHLLRVTPLPPRNHISSMCLKMRCMITLAVVLLANMFLGDGLALLLMTARPFCFTMHLSQRRLSRLWFMMGRLGPRGLRSFRVKGLGENIPIAS